MTYRLGAMFAHRRSFFGKNAFGLVFATLLIVTPGLTTHAAERASHGDTARYLAGLPVSEASNIKGLTKSRIWQSHARSLNNGWRILDRRQLSKIRTWSKTHLTNPSKTLFYMFSGPDYLYANTLFPNASTYVFAGLEPVGREPNLTNLSSGARSVGLSRLRGSMNSVLHLSFFITKKMKTNLRGRGFPGALPIIYVFLARADKNVEAVEYLKINLDGTLEVLPEKNAGSAKGVKITFSDHAGADPKTLYYFSTDISDSGLKRSGFLKFLGSLGRGDAFVKSASYLMHYSSFSTIRNFLMDRADRIVQDDSGIALRYFKKADWNFKPYGRYTGPISIFSKQYQSGMRRLFKQKNRQSIDFGIGYKWRKGSSNLLVAEKIKAAVEEKVLVPATPGEGANSTAPATPADAERAKAPEKAGAD